MPVLTCADSIAAGLEAMLAKHGMALSHVPTGEPIPGSYWGDAEAGLIGDTLYVRADTPLHSALHEACHYICMSPRRRDRLDTDAGGTDLEESAVCYLQILLAAHLPGVGANRLMADMDEWGYSFRLGSTRTWFEQDASDALEWLRHHKLINDKDIPTGRLRALPDA